MQSAELTADLLKTLNELLHPSIRLLLTNVARQFQSYPIEHCAESLTRMIKDRLSLPPISLSRWHGVSSLQWLTEFGLRIFCEPFSTRNWAKEELKSGVHYMTTLESLARICRYIALSRRLMSGQAEVDSQ